MVTIRTGREATKLEIKIDNIKRLTARLMKLDEVLHEEEFFDDDMRKLAEEKCWETIKELNEITSNDK